MDIRKVRKLIELLKETGVGEIEIHEGDDSVRISLHGAAPTTHAVAAAPTPMPATLPSSAAAEASPATPTPATPPTGHTILSPMVGTIYLAPKPGAQPFVEIGQRVKAGDTICVIEAMKMYNKIEADKNGVISARLVENEQPVEFDQALFIIDDE